MREPDQLGVERAYPQLAYCVRLVELKLAEPDGYVAADDGWTPASVDDEARKRAACARGSPPAASVKRSRG